VGKGKAKERAQSRQSIKKKVGWVLRS